MIRSSNETCSQTSSKTFHYLHPVEASNLTSECYHILISKEVNAFSNVALV